MMENVDIDGRQIRTEIVVAEHGTLSEYRHCQIAIVGLSIIIW